VLDAGPMPQELVGPRGDRLPMPVHGPLIANLWDGTLDETNLRALAAWRDAKASGALDDLHVVNIFATVPDAATAQTFLVDAPLVIDEAGRSLLRPVEVPRFITAVFGKQGRIQRRLRPEEPGYAAALHLAFANVTAAAAPPR
jgi:hypothetical protein